MPETTIVPGVPGIGARQVRLEDGALLTGAAKYTADLAVPGLTHAVFVRSPFAHARVTAIDAGEAMAMDGVVAVLTDADLRLGPVFYPGFAALFSLAAGMERYEPPQLPPSPGMLATSHLPAAPSPAWPLM